MRTIKFRVYTQEEGMIYNNVDCFISINQDGTINDSGFPKHHVMEFTGLKDKNGKDLYDGDLVDAGGTKIKIEWLPELCYGFWHEKYQEWYTLSFLKGFKSFEIIGNIHEVQ